MAYGNDWLVNGAPPFARFAIDNVAGARTHFTAPSMDDLVAELKSAFWVSLLGPGYDATLWRSALHKAFRAAGPKKRNLVHSRLNALRRFRNRVAHHEPIFSNAMQMHTECLEAVSWMCADTCAWAKHHSRFPAVHAAP
ncbi:hypothetical protein [Aquibium sp. ELW1220]|uniref:hypothetical protein n=1 Tax=Aquibium sp. ELW1220 TaxID=2976766 RepID=UPI0025B257D9|nr:hypothetical protein [Aquibium sp. ELW1220]MDN2582777.1 Abi family protein [Aquibium sp. ELW1220]